MTQRQSLDDLKGRTIEEVYIRLKWVEIYFTDGTHMSAVAEELFDTYDNNFKECANENK